MTDTDYDVVIVGAGITGALVAKTIADAQDSEIRSILILEAGVSTGTTAEGYRSFVQRYFEQAAKVPNAPYPTNDNAPEANVLDLTPVRDAPSDKGYMVQNGPFPFLSDYTRAQGGTTLHWLGTCLRMLPNDFRMNTLYHQAVDWPMEYQDLRPFYERAEREIGVAADIEDMVFPNMGPDYFSAGYQFPMHKIPQSYLDQRFAEGLAGMSVQIEGQAGDIDVALYSTPQGRNSTPNPLYDNGKGYTPVGMVGDPEKGMRCEGNSSCVPICPIQAKYNALKTLNAIRENRVKVEVRAQCVASKVLVDSCSGKVSGIEYKKYDDPDSPAHQTETVTGRIYVLAAHAIENAKLLLASDAANSSGQVGRNLMDHLVMLTWGLMPMNVGAFRGPGSTSGIPAFRDGDFRRYMSSFRVELGNWGWNWPAGAPVTDLNSMVDDENQFGTELRSRLAERVPRQFRIGWEAEQLPEATNRVRIDPAYTDQLGNFRPVIDYEVSGYSRAACAQARQISKQIDARLGIEDHTSYVPSDPGYFMFNGEGYTVNGAGHLVGTHCMGTSKSNSVVNRDQRSWDHENLYIVGCGSMATLGTSNPTLTAAALAIWAADSIQRDFKRGGAA